MNNDQRLEYVRRVDPGAIEEYEDRTLKKATNAREVEVFAPEGILTELGPVHAITYKGTLQGDTELYEHAFIGDAQPDLMVDARNTLHLVGGDYHVADVGIVDGPGENERQINPVQVNITLDDLGPIAKKIRRAIPGYIQYLDADHPDTQYPAYQVAVAMVDDIRNHKELKPHKGGMKRKIKITGEDIAKTTPYLTRIYPGDRFHSDPNSGGAFEEYMRRLIESAVEPKLKVNNPLTTDQHVKASTRAQRLSRKAGSETPQGRYWAGAMHAHDGAAYGTSFPGSSERENPSHSSAQDWRAAEINRIIEFFGWPIFETRYGERWTLDVQIKEHPRTGRPWYLLQWDTHNSPWYELMLDEEFSDGGPANDNLPPYEDPAYAGGNLGYPLEPLSGEPVDGMVHQWTEPPTDEEWLELEGETFPYNTTPRGSRASPSNPKEKPFSRAPLGSGGRFAACVDKMRRRGNVKDPKALCASIGRKKYGAKKMAAMAKAGRRNPRSNPEQPDPSYHEYWKEVQAIADLVFTDRLYAEYGDDADSYEALHQIIDSHQFVIYYPKAIQVMRYTDHEDAYIEEYGEWPAADSWGGLLSPLAYMAFYTDVVNATATEDNPHSPAYYRQREHNAKTDAERHHWRRMKGRARRSNPVVTNRVSPNSPIRNAGTLAAPLPGGYAGYGYPRVNAGVLAAPGSAPSPLDYPGAVNGSHGLLGPQIQRNVPGQPIANPVTKQDGKWHRLDVHNPLDKTRQKVKGYYLDSGDMFARILKYEPLKFPNYARGLADSYEAARQRFLTSREPWVVSVSGSWSTQDHPSKSAHTTLAAAKKAAEKHMKWSRSMGSS